MARVFDSRDFQRARDLEKKVRALDADDIVNWLIDLEDCATSLEEATEEGVRVMKEDRDNLSVVEDDAREVYDAAISMGEEAVKNWRMRAFP